MRVAILEDIKEIAERLQQLFGSQKDMECRQLYHNAEEAMQFLPANPVDIMIVDIGLPNKSGIEAIMYLSELCPGTQFCMFTVYEDDEKIFLSLQAGARGYILKSSPPDKIIEAVRELYAGGSPMSPSIARKVLNFFNKIPIVSNQNLAGLSSRENELLVHLAKGLYYKEIADLLGITTGTVKQHIHKIYEKLQVSNRTEAINKINHPLK
ncbi:MAG: response regulator transcription factor [Saprospiraceae bacterium]|nr:response regulator transcription factor [Saprospiraceae bacterium]